MPRTRKSSGSKPKAAALPEPKTARPRASKAGDLPPPGKFPFERELATYRGHLPELLEREGDYVVIRGEEVAGCCETVEAALWMGRALFGLEGFMIKQVLVEEPVIALLPELRGWRS